MPSNCDECWSRRYYSGLPVAGATIRWQQLAVDTSVHISYIDRTHELKERFHVSVRRLGSARARIQLELELELDFEWPAVTVASERSIMASFGLDGEVTANYDADGDGGMEARLCLQIARFTTPWV